MDTFKLRYFQAVAQTENVSQAAERLHISQAALSKAISLLENEVGTALFSRTGKKIQLNEAGRTFLRYTQTALTALDDGMDKVQKLTRPSAASIRLQTNISCDRYLVNMLRDFRLLHPDVKFDIIKNYSKSKFLYDCDLYIHAAPIVLARCTSVPLFTEELLLGVPTAHSLAKFDSIPLRMAADEPFVTLDRATSWTEEVTGFCLSAGFKPKFVYLCDGNEILARLIRAGEGVGFLPAESWGEFPDGVKLLHIEKPICRRSYNLSWRPDRVENPIAEEFREYVLSCFQKR